MKIEQFRQDLTTEQLNDTLGKVFGTAIDLSKFSTEQLETAPNPSFRQNCYNRTNRSI